MSALTVWAHNPTDASGGEVTRTLPAGQAQGVALSCEKYDDSPNAVTVAGDIRGVAGSTLTLRLQYESVTLRTDAAGSWWPVSGYQSLTATDARYARAGLPAWAGADRTGRFDTATGWYNLAPDSLAAWRTALGRALAGTGVAEVLFVGDSLGSDGWDGSAYHTAAGIPRQILAGLAQSTGLPIAGSGVVRAVSGGEPGVPSDLWSMGSPNTTASYDWGQTFPGLLLIGPGHWVAYGSVDAGTGVQVAYSDGGDAFTVSVDGATDGAGFAAVRPGGSAAIKAVTLTGLPNTTHDIRITATGSDPADIVSVAVTSPLTAGLRLHNIALGGTTAATGGAATNWNDTGNGYYGFAAARRAALDLAGADPALVVCSLGNNDALYGTASAEQIMAGIGAVRDWWPDASFVRIQPPTDPSWANVGAYLDAAYAHAETLGYPMLDLQARLGNRVTAHAAGYLGADQFHLAQEQSAIAGRAIADAARS